MAESKKQQLKSGGVLTVEHAQKIVRQKEDDVLEKARNAVERADAQIKNTYRKCFGERQKLHVDTNVTDDLSPCT
jgi:ElaB/YqjD/DUF883 family membrane-anchored ribosome-binding protein